MAWALRFSGDDKYIEIPRYLVPAGGYVSIRFTNFVYVPDRNSYIYGVLSFGFRVFVLPSGVIRLADSTQYTAFLDGVEVIHNSTLMPTDDQVHELRLVFSAARRLENPLNDPSDPTAGANLDFISLDLNGVRFLDAEQSDRSGSTNQPIITDTIGGNDATGVNFPPFDASVWVDLGGGGFVTAWALNSNKVIQ